MRLPFALRHALREGRSSVRRLGVYMTTITLGVAALVAINGYRSNAARSLELEARSLLGGDVRLSSGQTYTPAVEAIIDSAQARGARVSRVTATITMAISGGQRSRLVQVRAINGDYPFFRAIETQPSGLWPMLADGGIAVVEPGVTDALAARVGDSIRIGTRWLRIAATTSSLPPELSFRAVVGPRVFISAADLESTGLVTFGSLVRYEAFLAFTDDTEPARFARRFDDELRGTVSVETASEQARDLTRGLDGFTRFLGLIGLFALLLGGLGVASAVHVFVADKRPTVAVLRCVGASVRTTFTAYVLQAALLGLGGATVGAALGVIAQALLPRLLGDTLPFATSFALEPLPLLAGIGTGVWVATVFALLPLLEIRRVSPLAALRHEVEPQRTGRDPLRLVTFAALFASVTVLAVWQAPEPEIGLAFALGIGFTTLVLWAAARAAMALTLRLRPRRGPFPVRQGVASLFRPHNQTVAVTIALGFGVFLVVSLWIVQVNLAQSLAPERPEIQPNLVAFDIQPDQRADVEDILRGYGADAIRVVPLVTARIAALNGMSIDSLTGDRRTAMAAASRAGLSDRPESWALRREYRNTFRDTLTSSETLVAGTWWNGAREPGSVARVSVEQDVARDLGIGIGDRITWNVAGVDIETRVASLRTVDWVRFDTNFFVVFEPGVLDDAPQNLVAVARVPDSGRLRAQTAIATEHANISVIDLGTVQATLERLVRGVLLAIRFMALFSLATGTLVLAGAISASRFQRVRESVLLRTLGATKRQVRTMLVVEYGMLGALAGAIGCALGAASGWGLVVLVFDLPFRMPLGPVALFFAAVVVLATSVGLVNGGEALRRTTLGALREAEG